MQDLHKEAKGKEHPMGQAVAQTAEIFANLGFEIALGPELETEWYNFDALNVPKDHPARDMQDTFWIKNEEGKVLRTHTTSVTARFLEKAAQDNKIPCGYVSIGKVFRNEATDGTHEMQFFQIDGFMIGADISLSHMKGVLTHFYKKMLGSDTEIQFRPSFFPFTEPSAEMDVYWGLNNEDDYRITKGTGWLEILGCGMVDPNVLINCGIDPNEYSGFAFGMGIERQAMLQFKITDIRQLFENDTRFLKQFSGVI